jgi:polysaccharide pyruvyl transferase WcaK-like protein
MGRLRIYQSADEAGMSSKTIGDVFARENLEHSVLIGYYGGGNYGDELLLEVLMNLFAAKQVKELTITYQQPARYIKFHHDFGYERIDMGDKRAVLGAIARNKNIIIGGGGLWGLDMNPNIFLLSCLLLFSKLVLRKKVYLLGVGFYSSTNWLGRLSARLAAWSAFVIIARDEETLQNFSKYQFHTYFDKDIAWYSRRLPTLSKDYKADEALLDDKLSVTEKTLFISLRRFRPGQQNNYDSFVGEIIRTSPARPIIVAIMEPKDVDPEGYKQLLAWQKAHGNLQIVDFSYNPIGLIQFFKANHEHLALIAPQFHLIITAELAGVPFLPMAYDNKVEQLLKQLGYDSIPIQQLQQSDLQQFIEEYLPNAQTAPR